MIARRKVLGLFAAAVAVSSLAACAGTPPTVSGTVSYRERLVLPADSSVVVRLEDVTRGTGAPVTVAEQRIAPTASGPIHFAIPYERGDINPNATYVVNAWIERNGQLLFRNQDLHQVLTKTAPSSNIKIELVRVAGTMPAPVGSGTTIVPSGSGSTVIVQPSTGGTTTVTPSGGNVIIQQPR